MDKNEMNELHKEYIERLHGYIDSDKIEQSDKATEKPNLEWYEKINKINRERKSLADIPDEKKSLYKEGFGGLEYNWEAIYYAIFKDKAEGYENAQKHMKIPTCAIPNGMKEFFEVDENGNPTGNYNWEYIKQLIKDFSDQDITEYENFGIENDNDIVDYMPTHVALIFENLDNPIELHENLIAGELDTNCPNDIKNNPQRMLELFKISDWDEIIECWNLMSDDLKKDGGFLLKLMSLASVKESPDIISQIDPALYEKDEEFKKSMIDCWGLYGLYETWKYTEELWEYAMENIGNEEFIESVSDFDLELVQEHNPKFVKLVELEMAKRERQNLDEEEQSISEAENLIDRKENPGQNIPK